MRFSQQRMSIKVEMVFSGTCVIYWKNGGVIGIQDPNFQGIGGRLQNYPGLQIVKAVLQQKEWQSMKYELVEVEI